MAETIITAISRRLKRGYSVATLTANTYGVVDPHGEFVKYEGITISFRSGPIPTGHFYPNLIASLKRAGALQVRRKPHGDHKPREVAHVSHRDPKNAVIIAEETLRDAQASARERALARNYLAMVESQRTLRQLCRALGQRLRELEDSLEGEDE